MSQWYRSELFDCFDDIGICIYGCCCPQCLNASNLAKLRSEDCGIFHYCCSFSPFWIRHSVRIQRNIEIDQYDDCCTVCFCKPCAICQDARELKQSY